MIDYQIEMPVRVNEIRSSKDEARRYVSFNSLDFGTFSYSFRADEWNGHSEKSDVVLVLEPARITGTRALDSGRHMATEDLGLRCVEVRYPGAKA